MKRLIRKSDYPVTDWFHDEESQDINDEDEATGIHYGPGLDQEQQWSLEDPVSNPEWALRDSMGSKLKTK